MKYTTAVLALAAVAVAAPAEIEKRGGTCNNSNANVCCNVILGLNLCQVVAIGQTCSGSSYCCDNAGSTGGLININLLNCVKLL